MIEPKDVKIERRPGGIPGTLELVARIDRHWIWTVSENALGTLRREENAQAHEDFLRRGVLHDIYGGIVETVAVVRMALNLLRASSRLDGGYLAPGSVDEALAKLDAIAAACRPEPTADTSVAERYTGEGKP